jgi:hypothetical protein
MSAPTGCPLGAFSRLGGFELHDRQSLDGGRRLERMTFVNES